MLMLLHWNSPSVPSSTEELWTLHQSWWCHMTLTTGARGRGGSGDQTYISLVRVGTKTNVIYSPGWILLFIHNPRNTLVTVLISEPILPICICCFLLYRKCCWEFFLTDFSNSRKIRTPFLWPVVPQEILGLAFDSPPRFLIGWGAGSTFSAGKMNIFQFQYSVSSSSGNKNIGTCTQYRKNRASLQNRADLKNTALWPLDRTNNHRKYVFISWWTSR